MSKKKKEEIIDADTGLIEEQGVLNEVIEIHSRRADGSLRIQLDFRNCPTMAEQHTAHLSDINYLISRYKPDELANYIAARNQYRREILGHDFTVEPDLQTALNIRYKLKEAFDRLPDHIKDNFKNHVEFLKFIDNPANQEKMMKLGLMTKEEIEKHTGKQKNDKPNDEKKQPDKADQIKQSKEASP